MKRGVIYTITNEVTGYYYIGASTRFEERIKDHFRRLKKNSHENMIIQRDFNFYGEVAFTSKIIEETTLENLEELETKFIEDSDPRTTYNIAVGVMNNLARHPKREGILERMRLSKLGEGNPNWKGGISFVNCVDCGISISQDSERCSECHFNQRDVSGDKNPFYGRTHSKETRLKISKTRLGKKTYNSKAVIVRGVRYETVGEASRQIGVHRATLKYWLENPRPKYSEYYYEEEL